MYDFFFFLIFSQMANPKNGLAHFYRTHFDKFYQKLNDMRVGLTIFEKVRF
jgi:hypothetical protein